MTCRARNIFLIGPMAAGKSSVGRCLARRLAYHFYDTDEEIRKEAKISVFEYFAAYGEARFRCVEEHMVGRLARKSGIILATGGGAILSATNRAVLKARGTIVYLKVSVEQQLLRTKYDAARPLLQVSNPRAQLFSLAQQRIPLYEQLADVSFTTDNISILTISNRIFNYIHKCPIK